jgi:hypothetical protein
MEVALVILSILYFCFGVWTLIFYINDFVIPITKEDDFNWNMVVVMLIALLLPPVHWFLYHLFKNAKIM